MNGKPVADAKITVTDLKSGASEEYVTDRDGRPRLPHDQKQRMLDALFMAGIQWGALSPTEIVDALDAAGFMVVRKMAAPMLLWRTLSDEESIVTHPNYPPVIYNFKTREATELGSVTVP